MNLKFACVLVGLCSLFSVGESARFTLAAANLAGCNDFIWEPECDAAIHIFYLDGGLLPDWQFYQSTGTIPNNNNPSYPTIFEIPSDAKEFKFVVIDDDAGIDDVMGYATALTTEILSGVGGITVKPIALGKGRGFVHITLRP